MLDLTKHSCVRTAGAKQKPREIISICWQSSTHAVCTAIGIDEPLLIDLHTHRVLNADYTSWRVVNEPEEVSERSGTSSAS